MSSSPGGASGRHAVRYPPHVHQPLIQTIVDELAGQGSAPRPVRAVRVRPRCWTCLRCQSVNLTHVKSQSQAAKSTTPMPKSQIQVPSPSSKTLGFGVGSGLAWSWIGIWQQPPSSDPPPTSCGRGVRARQGSPPGSRADGGRLHGARKRPSAVRWAFTPVEMPRRRRPAAGRMVRDAPRDCRRITTGRTPAG